MPPRAPLAAHPRYVTSMYDYAFDELGTLWEDCLRAFILFSHTLFDKSPTYTVTQLIDW
jgi:hypothetical protein